MNTQHPTSDSSCTQLGHGRHATAAHRHRTSRYAIAALGHRIAAGLIKSDGFRPGAPPGEGGSG
jgi:hypothetical protein